MGTVFILNSVALFIFPAVGSALHLIQNQFGLWAALAIHNTSSVVGASAKYGNAALMIGTTVKLARSLWIIPVSLAVAAWYHARAHRSGESVGHSTIKWPWFILFFCLAGIWRTYEASLTPLFDNMAHLGRLGLTATLFLIGSGLSRKTLRQVGYRPMPQGLLLWIIVATLSLAAIYERLIFV